MTLLVVGGDGQVGAALLRAARARRLPARGLGRRELDIRDARAVERELVRGDVEAVVNAAAFTGVDAAESDGETAYAVNRDGVAHLARACARLGRPMIHLSTDYVFDGAKAGPYRESDAARPLGVYGASKLAGERALRELLPAHVILRTSWVFSATGHNFVKTMRRLAARDDAAIRVVDDQVGCPTAAADIAEAILDVAARLRAPGPHAWGLYHFCGKPRTTWYRFARAVLGTTADRRLCPIPTRDHPTPARRPANSTLDCRRIRRAFAISRPDWRPALARVLADLDRAERS